MWKIYFKKLQWITSTTVELLEMFESHKSGKTNLNLHLCSNNRIRTILHLLNEYWRTPLNAAFLCKHKDCEEVRGKNMQEWGEELIPQGGENKGR